MKTELEIAKVNDDPEIMKKVEELMKQADPEGASTGKYDLRGAKGVQIGDQNTQTNTFN